MLIEVVDNALLGGTVKMDNYSIGAKTGTAQMAKEDGRGYYEDKYLHSFFGTKIDRDTSSLHASRREINRAEIDYNTLIEALENTHTHLHQKLSAN